jgi:hypothetical protein
MFVRVRSAVLLKGFLTNENPMVFRLGTREPVDGVRLSDVSPECIEEYEAARLAEGMEPATFRVVQKK